MTGNPVTRMFYLNNYNRRRREGTNFARVTVRGEKISVHTKTLETSKGTGNLVEVLVSVITYSTHVNRHGAKYLKVEKTLPKGPTEDVCVELMSYKEVLYYVQFLGASKTLETFLEKSISRWFKIPYSPGCLKNKYLLLFPSLTAYKEDEIRPLLKELRELDISGGRDGRVVNALRASADLSSALKRLCGETLQNEADVMHLLRSPHLLHVADMELGMTISEFVESSENPPPLSIRQSVNVLKFMLKHLAGDKKEAVLSILRGSRISPLLDSDRAPERGKTYWREACQYVDSCLHLTLPKAQCEAMAEELFTYFTLPIVEVVGFYPTERTLDLRFQRWVSENVLEPAVVSEATVEDVQTVFREAFMPDCNHGIEVECEHDAGARGIRFKTDQRGTTFCTVSDSYALTAFGEENYTDLTSNLVLLAGRSNGRILHIGIGGHRYVDSIYGKMTLLDGDIYPLDKMMQLIRLGVEETDKRLTKLGRKTTPQNRVAYLKFGKEERDFKIAWKYYDLGVTTPAKIVALMQAKITSQRDIEMYASLPDDMFYEFLETASGKKLREQS